MRNRLVGLFVCAVASGATAVAYAAGPGWTVESQVVRIVTTFNGGVNVRLSPELSGCESQSGYGERYASIYPEHPGIDKMHANLLAAYMSGKKVALYFTDDKCKVGEVVIGGAH